MTDTSKPLWGSQADLKERHPTERRNYGRYALLNKENYISTLHEELMASSFLGSTKLSLITDYLENAGIYSLSEVDASLVTGFFQMIYSSDTFTDSIKSQYASALETAVRVFYEDASILSEIDELGLQKPIRNKLHFFLSINHINHLTEIDEKLRIDYETYLLGTIRCKHSEYLKAIDVANLRAIEEASNEFRPHALKYENQLLYLAYHLDFETASRFHRAQVKEPLFFDFSLNISEVIKRQIFSLLKHYVEDEKDRRSHYIIQHFVTPLWDFYNYCIEHNISDITEIKATEVENYKGYCKELETKN